MFQAETNKLVFDCVNDLLDGTLTSHSRAVRVDDPNINDVRAIDLYHAVLAKYFGNDDSVIKKL